MGASRLWGLYTLVPPPRLVEETFTVRMDDGGTFEVTRERLERTMRSVGPQGKWYFHRLLNQSSVNTDDIDAASRHFGLEHLLADISSEEIMREIDARRVRGAPPTDRPAPYMAEMDRRERIDAMLDVYERRVSEAAAGAARANSKGAAAGR